MIDKKSKILLRIFFFIVGIFVVATFYRYIVLKDFKVFTDEEIFNESLLDK